MNIKNIILAAAQFMKPERKEQLQQAIQKAEQILNENPVRNLQDAQNVLRKVGINNDVITKILGYANHPAVTTILNMSGINKNGLINDLQQLQGANTAPTQQAPQSDDLSRFRVGLERLGKK